MYSDVAKAQGIKRIDFDYKKIVPFSILSTDYNSNGEREDNEMTYWDEDSKFYITYNDYGESGSLMSVEISLKSHKGTLLLKGNLEDVKLYHASNEKLQSYICVNKLEEPQFIIATDKTENITTIWIANIAFLKKVAETFGD